MKSRRFLCTGWALALSLAAFPAAAAVDLETALGQVAAANPTLAARRAMVEAARRRLGPAGAWAPPIVELGVVNVPTSGRFDADPMTMKMMGVTQRVPVFGARGLARQSAVEALEAEKASAERAGFEILGLAWESYADAYIGGQLAGQAEVHRDIMDRLVESARVRYQSGKGRLEDVLRAEAERGRIESEGAGFRAEERVARARLDALRGIEPGKFGEPLAPPPAPRVPGKPDEWLAAVDGSQPRLRERVATVNRYRLAARASRRMVWPDLELRASYGTRETLAGGAEQDGMFSVAVGFMVPVFAGQRELSEAAEMEAMAVASEAERRAAEFELRQEIVMAWAAAAAAQRTAFLMDTVLATQRRGVEAAWSSYRAGTADLPRIFDSSHSVYASELALLRARQELARAQARLVSLTGRSDLLGIVLPATGGAR
jgi:cobalt-zinc-cadmium efflux system outer membrane protein